MRLRSLVVLAAAALSVAAAGCGLGPGKSAGAAELVVTRDFGQRPVGGPAQDVEAQGQDTVMRMLERRFKVTTRYGGGFVQSIDGIAGGHSAGRPVDWFIYVNGSEASKGAAAVRVHDGDVVWWDFHDWGSAMDTPAVVGAFPEPFRHGFDGERLPVRIVCAADAQAACNTASSRLADVGVLAAQAAMPSQSGEHSLRILVGRWSEIRSDFAARELEQGPQASGVFARPSPDGSTIAVLDQRGAVVRRLGAGTGLVAAAEFQHQDPTWFVTGTDDAGVRQAAAALTVDALHHRFAIAVRQSLPTPLPVVRP